MAPALLSSAASARSAPREQLRPRARGPGPRALLLPGPALQLRLPWSAQLQPGPGASQAAGSRRITVLLTAPITFGLFSDESASLASQ